MFAREANSDSRDSRRRALASGALLAAVVIAAYAASLRGGFLWDDDVNVTANPCIVGPLGLREIWTTAAANYFPLVLTSYWLQHLAWGLNPLGYHVVTLACHVLSAVLLWRVLLQLDAPGAWLGAALWALHPVQVESVAWISELKNTQSAVFFFLAIHLFLRWLEGGRSSYALALLCASLALLSKPSTVMLPVALGLCVWWRREELRWRDVRALAPFLALSGLAAGWAIWEQKFHSGATGVEWAQSVPERVLISGRAVWSYLATLAWPGALAFIYPRWQVEATSLVAYLPFATAFGAMLMAWYGRRTRRAAFFVAAYFAALLFPVLGFFSIYFFRYSFVADHFQYLASIGPLALLGAGVARLPRRFAGVAAVALLLGYSVLTWRHAATFANNETLWRATLDRNPDAPMARLNLGATLAKQHRDAEAIACFRRVAEMRPNDADALADAGWGLVAAGYPEPALPLLERALQLDPKHREAHNTLGNALRKMGRHDEAIAHYLRALELKPESAEAHSNLGSAFAETGRLAEAQAQFERAIRIDRRFVPAHANLGTALGLAGCWADAIGPLREALRLQPDYPDASEKLAVALANTGHLAEAVPQFERALQLNPAAAHARQGYAEVLRRLGREREAADVLRDTPSPP